MERGGGGGGGGRGEGRVGVEMRMGMKKGMERERVCVAIQKALELMQIGHIFMLYTKCLLWPVQVRCDSGIVEGSEISIYYDSMISKVRY